MLKRRYWHEVAGSNFRLTNLQAALGCAQFERIDDIVAARRRMRDAYETLLRGVHGSEMQTFRPEVDPVVWAVAVRLDAAAYPQGRDTVMAQMLERGIETRNGFCSPAEMSHLYGVVENIPNARVLSDNVISLPSYPTLSPDEIGRICGVLFSLRR
jgi:perosamine synthetase